MPRLARRLPALFLALFLSGPAGPPQAAAAQWSVGAWTGNSYVNRTGAFSHCIMNARYNSGITLYFMQFSDHDLFIGISAPDWSLDPHSPYTLTLMIDGKEIRSAPGTVLRHDTNRLWLALGKDRQTRERLRWGLKLRLVQGDRDYGFQLTGTAIALRQLEQCVVKGNETDRPHPAKPRPIVDRIQPQTWKRLPAPAGPNRAVDGSAGTL